MTKKTLDWTPDLELPTGTGATFQKFKAQSGDDQLEIKATEGAKVISRSMPRKSPALQTTVMRPKSFEILKKSRRIMSARTSKCRKV